MTISSITRRATLDDLSREEGKAELIGGRIVRYMASGHLPSTVAGEIFVSLRLYAKASGRGAAYGDGVGYAVPELPSGRESFSPDASYVFGPFVSDPMKFLDAPPTFAVEVRSEGDYGPAAEREMAAKRAGYFAAGTKVVWDVDLLDEDVVRSYSASASNNPHIFRRGDIADAEPAVPSWRMPVDDLFD